MHNGIERSAAVAEVAPESATSVTELAETPPAPAPTKDPKLFRERGIFELGFGVIVTPAVQEIADRVFCDELLLPEQYSERVSAAVVDNPDLALRLAVLCDAIEDVMIYSMPEDSDELEALEDALAWIGMNDRMWPFSFETLCDLFDIDPDYLRDGLESWRWRHVDTPARSTLHKRRMGGTRHTVKLRERRHANSDEAGN